MYIESKCKSERTLHFENTQEFKLYACQSTYGAQSVKNLRKIIIYLKDKSFLSRKKVNQLKWYK